jgi:cell division protein FtsQ
VRKTYSTSSRSASAVEDGDYGDLLEQARPRGPRRKQEAASRFDDFDPRDLAFDDYDEEPSRTTRGATSRSRSRKSTSVSVGQLLIKTTAGRVVLGICVVLVLGALGASVWMVREFLRTDPRFRVATSEQIEVDGNHQVSADDVRSVFGEDIGRNLFFIPIELRRQEMEGLPWVERASVERLLPNRIHVRVTERVPMAFAQNGGELQLIDRHGVLLGLPSGASQYSFPVLHGVGDDVPLSTRRARMDEYAAFLKDIDGHGERVSSRLSEVDLSEPEDVQALLAEGSAAITLHFGDANFFEKYQMYQTHLAEWQQQYPRLAKVDLRNAPQVVLGMGDAAGAVKAPVATPAATTSSIPDATAPATKEIAATPPPAPKPVSAPVSAAPVATASTAPTTATVKTPEVAKSKSKAVATAKTPAGKHPAPKPVAAATKKSAPPAAPANAIASAPATRHATDAAAQDTFKNETAQPAAPHRPRLVMPAQLPQAVATPAAARTPSGGQQ